MVLSFFFSKLDDGYGGVMYKPTMAGYTAIALLLIAVLLLASAARQRISGESRRVNIRQLTFSAMAVALAMITSMIRIVSLPMGGYVSLMSMFFITLIGTWYGLSGGIACGIAYGMLQMIVDPYMISIPQILCDYIFAFGALGLSGLFAKSSHPYIKGYITGVIGRCFFSTMSGIIFFAAFAPSEGPLSNPVLYSVAYNVSYMFAEAAITIIIISLPPVARALESVRKMNGVRTD